VLKAEEKGLEITYVVDSGVPTMVLGDSLRLGQVLTNLVSNAVKFTEVGDVVVRVSVYEEAGKQYLHFAVSDTGVGISPEQVSRLFQPFSQARTDTSRHYGGTGLGLVISKRLIEMMEGTIGVHSKLGIGSTFFFMVPLQAVAGTEETTVCSNTRTMSLQGRRILIADDNNTSRMALAEIAEGFGMEATLAGNGKEAIELLHQHAAANHPFDLVMLDWHMPTMDGAEAARLIKTDVQLERMPAVMMVTAYGQESMLQACQGVELQGVLHKPVTHSSMYDILLKASSVVNAVAGFPSLTGGEGDDLRVFAALQGKHVLVVDDNALNREVATDFLACVGVKVHTAGDGLAAIRCLESQDVDAVLMDIHMPHMNGLQATREIRRYARWKQLP
jgi:two-component system sensor histidine kinase/response regulator